MMYQGLCLFVFFLVSSLAHPPQSFSPGSNDYTSQELSECRRRSGIDDTNFAYDIEIISQSREKSCYVMCLGFYREKVSSEGRLITTKRKSKNFQLLSESSVIAAVVRKGLEECANDIETDDFCDTAWKTVQCLSKNPMLKKYKKGTDITPVYNAIVKVIASS